MHREFFVFSFVKKIGMKTQLNMCFTWHYSKECYRIELIWSKRNETAFLIFVNEYIAVESNEINWNYEINSMNVGSLNSSPFSEAGMKCWIFLIVCKYTDNLPSVGVQNDWRKKEIHSESLTEMANELVFANENYMKCIGRNETDLSFLPMYFIWFSFAYVVASFACSGSEECIPFCWGQSNHLNIV